MAYQASNPAYTRRYVYLHGRYNDPSRVVLTDRDYTTRYLTDGSASSRLSALFSTFTLVFIGFSLSDPALMQLLREVKLSMGPGAPRHYALLALNTAKENEMLERIRLATKFGVEPIFYLYDSGHEELCKILNSLAARATPEGEPPPMPEMVRPTGPQDPNDPQQGEWGGESEANGYRLTATVSRISRQGISSEQGESMSGGRLYLVRLTVRQLYGNSTGTVRFHLHPTFVPDRRDVPLVNGEATLELTAYGAFTVGAQVLGTGTRLELDLASESVEAPRRFKQS